MSKFDRTVRKFSDVMKKTEKTKTLPYDERAVVKRIDGNIAWVHIPGGIDETPVQLTVDAKAGDLVQIRVSGGRAWITGNATAPPTDDTVAKEASDGVKVINKVVKAINTTLSKIGEVAGNTAQYFWHTETGTDTGVHITEVPREDFLADPENGGGNLLARSLGIAIRKGLTELATFTANKISLGKNSPTAQIYLCDEQGRIYYSDGVLVLSGDEATGIKSALSSNAYSQVAVASNDDQKAATVEVYDGNGHRSVLSLTPTGTSLASENFLYNGGSVVTANAVMVEGQMTMKGKITHGTGRRYATTVNVPAGYRLAAVRAVTSNHNQYLRITEFGVLPGNSVWVKVFNEAANTDYTDAQVTIYWLGIRCSGVVPISPETIDLGDSYTPGA